MVTRTRAVVFPTVLIAALLVSIPEVLPGQTDAPALTDAEMELFLKTARIVRTRGVSKGVTASRRATLSDGKLTHDAQIQTVDEKLRMFHSVQGIEFDFHDNWRYNIAAYRVDRLLGFNMVPVTVERAWNQQPAAFTWWVDDVIMDEGEHVKTKAQAPDVRCWNEQVRLLRVLDQLIANTDRNYGNILITRDWRVWAIDHTRAFRRGRKPHSLLGLTWIDRGVFERLVSLDEKTLDREIGDYVGTFEQRALLARRDVIVAHFRAAGPAAVSDRQPLSSCTTAQ